MVKNTLLQHRIFSSYYIAINHKYEWFVTHCLNYLNTSVSDGKVWSAGAGWEGGSKKWS